MKNSRPSVSITPRRDYTWLVDLRRKNLSRVAAWIDHIHPSTAPHCVSCEIHYNRASEHDLATVYATPLHQYISSEARRALREEAEAGMRSFGYTIGLTGADIVSRPDEGVASNLTAHERIEAIGQLLGLLTSPTSAR